MFNLFIMFDRIDYICIPSYGLKLACNESNEGEILMSIAFEKTPNISLSFKPVPVQYWEYGWLTQKLSQKLCNKQWFSSCNYLSKIIHSIIDCSVVKPKSVDSYKGGRQSNEPINIWSRYMHSREADMECQKMCVNK